MASNFNSVRKAFLELDEKHIGYITAEEIAKFLGASQQQRFDFSLLEILIKMRTSNLGHRIFYKDFCAWLGSTVEPTESFYFRHDSVKNPQYELNMQKSRESKASNQLAVRKIMTADFKTVKEKFLARTFQTYKTVKKAFIEWKNNKSHIEEGDFCELMLAWGFTENCVSELFQWLDMDGDGKISFDDLKQTAGVEITPMEQFFFRQDVQGSKNIPCSYHGCWENLLYSKSKSPYCDLHQKIVRKGVLDLFGSLSGQFSPQEWDLFTYELIKSNYIIKIGELLAKIESYKGLKLTQSE